MANDLMRLWLSSRLSCECALSALVYAPVALRKGLVTFDLYSILEQVREVQAAISLTLHSSHLSSSASIAGFGTLLPYWGALLFTFHWFREGCIIDENIVKWRMSADGRRPKKRKSYWGEEDYALSHRVWRCALPPS